METKATYSPRDFGRMAFADDLLPNVPLYIAGTIRDEDGSALLVHSLKGHDWHVQPEDLTLVEGPLALFEACDDDGNVLTTVQAFDSSGAFVRFFQILKGQDLEAWIDGNHCIRWVVVDMRLQELEQELAKAQSRLQELEQELAKYNEAGWHDWDEMQWQASQMRNAERWVEEAEIALEQYRLERDPRITYEHRDGEIVVHRWGVYPAGSVLAGLPSKQYLGTYATEDDALDAHPDAVPSHPWLQPQVSVDHLPDEQEVL